MTLTDAAGEITSDDLTVSVKNVAPAVDAGKYPVTKPGDTVQFAGSFKDPGAADTHVITWDFGDGTGAEGTLTPAHTYMAAGTYVVKLTVMDDDGGTGEDTAPVTVTSSSLVSMAKFEITYVKLNFREHVCGDKIVVLGTLKLDLANGNGADISEDVIVTVGPLTETIIMYKKGNKNTWWEYLRPQHAPGAIQYMTINWKNGDFEIRLDTDDFDDFANPVAISVQIGDDYGEQTVKMKEQNWYWLYNGQHWPD
jgi:PKD repeat protein